MFPTGDDPEGAGLDLGALMQQAQQMQERLMATQAELAEAEVEGTAGNGLVKATVSGTGDVKSLTIAPEAADPDDTETLADLVVAAIRDATVQQQQLAAERLGPFAAGLGGGVLGGGVLGGGVLGGEGPPAPGGQLGF